MYITDTIEKIKTMFYTTEKASQLNSIFTLLLKEQRNRSEEDEKYFNDLIKDQLEVWDKTIK